MYDYDYIGGSSNNLGSAAAGSVIWGIIAAVLAVVGGILVYFLFLNSLPSLFFFLSMHHNL